MERWKPKKGENYWCVNFKGEVFGFPWLNNSLDNEVFNIGNCFKTKEDAEAAAEKVKELLLNLQPTCNQLATDLQENIQDMVTNTCQAMDKGKENVAKATCTFGNLPKLTAEVFDRPDCPEWAKYAAVDKDGKGFYYLNKPTKKENKKWSLFGVGDYQHIGIFDASDWHNILIERPAKLPDWCKVGEWVYTCNADYRQVESIIDGIVHLSGGLNIPVGDIHNELVCARLRPFNSDEMKALFGRVIEKGPSMHIVTGFENVFDNECMVHVNGCLYGANDLLRQFTINGSPCGCLEHLENGEWVQ